MESRPTWARGLKQATEIAVEAGVLSRPTWARGLKLQKADERTED